MNRLNLEDYCWAYMGRSQSNQQQDYMRQKIWDALNNTMGMLASVYPTLTCFIREGTLNIVNGVGTYFLDDWCAKPLSVYTSDVTAHNVRFMTARNADRSGYRSSAFSDGSTGPYTGVWAPHNTAAVYSGASGASTGATVAEAGTVITLAGVTLPVNGVVGRMVKLNGEYGDYKVISNTASTVTVDRAVRGRLPTTTTAVGVGTGYAAVRWEIGPTQRVRVQFLPTPQTANTINFRMAAWPRKLMASDEEPEIQDQFHHLIYKGALVELGAFMEDSKTYQMFKAEFEQELSRLRAQDTEEDIREDTPMINWASNNHGRVLSPGVLPPRSWNW